MILERGRVGLVMLHAYNDGVVFAFRGKKMPTLIKNAGIKKPHATNTRDEMGGEITP
jgi:hypothetical protein